jgi:uncharacterized protein
MKNTSIPAETKADEINFTTKVFGWLTVGLFVSGIVAFKLFQNYNLVQTIMSNYFILGILVLGFIGLVIWISLTMDKWDFNKIRLFFFGFAILNGIILPLIFQFFTQDFILSTFFILAGMFGIMGVVGYFFKQNLLSWQSLILLAIIGIVLNVLLNLLWRNDQFQLIVSGIAILVFVGIAAYSFETIQEMNETNEPQKAVIMGAFALSLNLYYLFVAIVFSENKSEKKINS